MAGLPMGGGKAVVLFDPGRRNTRNACRVRRCGYHDALGGRCQRDEPRTSVHPKSRADIVAIAERTPHVCGTCRWVSARWAATRGPFTARHLPRASRPRRWRTSFGQRSGLKGVRVALQELSAASAARLRGCWQGEARALTVADVDAAKSAGAGGRDLGSGGSCRGRDQQKMRELRCSARKRPRRDPRRREGIGRLALRGGCRSGASNQLARRGHGTRAGRARDPLCADYVINDGGIINVSLEYLKRPTWRAVRRRRGAPADRADPQRAARGDLARERRERARARRRGRRMAQKLIEAELTKSFLGGESRRRLGLGVGTYGVDCALQPTSALHLPGFARRRALSAPVRFRTTFANSPGAPELRGPSARAWGPAMKRLSTQGRVVSADVAAAEVRAGTGGPPAPGVKHLRSKRPPLRARTWDPCTASPIRPFSWNGPLAGPGAAAASGLAHGRRGAGLGPDQDLPPSAYRARTVRIVLMHVPTAWLGMAEVERDHDVNLAWSSSSSGMPPALAAIAARARRAAHGAVFALQRDVPSRPARSTGPSCAWGTLVGVGRSADLDRSCCCSFTLPLPGARQRRRPRGRIEPDPGDLWACRRDQHP